MYLRPELGFLGLGFLFFLFLFLSSLFSSDEFRVTQVSFRLEEPFLGFFDRDCLSSSSSAHLWASSSPSLWVTLSWAHSPGCPPQEWLLEGVSLQSDFFFFQSGLSGLGMLSREAMWCRFWFSVYWDLLRLLEDGRDSGLLGS